MTAQLDALRYDATDGAAVDLALVAVAVAACDRPVVQTSPTPPTEPHVEGGRVRKDRRGRLVVVVAGVGPADYQGQLPGGRSVALEAKSREGRLYRDEVPEHQAADLDACAAGGGLAVLVARLDGVVHAIPWREVPWCSPRGGKPSIGAGDVTAWAVDARCLLDPRDARWRFYLEPLAGGRDA